MTNKEIDTLPAGRELDALVAERVMGFILTVPGQRIAVAGISGSGEPLSGDGRQYLDEYVCPCYSTNITAAWEVVEKFPRPIEILRRQDGTWHVDADACECGGHGPTATGETAPLAICRAALRAVMLDGR